MGVIKFCILFMVISFFSCNQPYKAGNLIDLSYPIETPMRSEIIMRYLDSLIKNGGYNIPEKWSQFNKLVDLDSINNKRIYFKNDPEEMYLLSFGGMLVLSDVYNPQIREGDWVSKRSLMSKEQEQRVKRRLQKEILDVIEAKAKREGLTDSVVYK